MLDPLKALRELVRALDKCIVHGHGPNAGAHHDRFLISLEESRELLRSHPEPEAVADVD